MAKRIANQFIIAAFNSEDGVDKAERAIMDQEFESKWLRWLLLSVEHVNVSFSFSDVQPSSLYR